MDFCKLKLTRYLLIIWYGWWGLSGFLPEVVLGWEMVSKALIGMVDAPISMGQKVAKRKRWKDEAQPSACMVALLGI